MTTLDLLIFAALVSLVSIYLEPQTYPILEVASLLDSFAAIYRTENLASTLSTRVLYRSTEVEAQLLTQFKAMPTLFLLSLRLISTC